MSTDLILAEVKCQLSTFVVIFMSLLHYTSTLKAPVCVLFLLPPSAPPAHLQSIMSWAELWLIEKKNLIWHINSHCWITYQRIEFIFNFALQQFPHNRRSSRQTESKTKTQTAAWEVRSSAPEGARGWGWGWGGSTVIMRGWCVCVCTCVHVCFALYIIAPLPVVIAWPKVSAHYHLNSFVVGFIRWVHTRRAQTHRLTYTNTHVCAQTHYSFSRTAGWKRLAVKCMQVENEF